MSVRDVLIVGGSVAGLSAALLLGRCGRNVLVCDSGYPRNRFSAHMHGFLSRDNIPPREFLRISRAQVAAYPSVSFREGVVRSIRKSEEGFVAVMDDTTKAAARTVLLAMGIVDELPAVPGIDAFYGTSVHHCPYCDGWEHRGEPIAIYGRGEGGLALAEEMLIWTQDLIYCTDGESATDSQRQRLNELSVRLIESPIAELQGCDGSLEEIRFSDGEAIRRTAVFFVSPQRQASDLARQLGCKLGDCDCVDCGEGVQTSVPGVYAAGNTTTGLQLAIVAAAEGAKAAHEINTALMADRHCSTAGAFVGQ